MTFPWMPPVERCCSVGFPETLIAPSVRRSTQGVGAMLNDLGKAEIRQLHIAVRVDQNVLLQFSATGSGYLMISESP